MCNVSIELGMVVKEDVLFVAVDGRGGTFGEFHAWACAPKVKILVRGSYIGTSGRVLSHGSGVREGSSWSAKV